MSPIKETRQIAFKDIVVKPEDVRTLAKVMTDAAEAFKKPKLSFEVQAEGGRSYESETVELFEKGGVLDTKQILSIELLFTDHETGSRIRINLTHGRAGDGYSNYLEVIGRNSTWVHGTTRKLEETLSEFEEQASWPRKWEIPLKIVAAFGIGRAWVALQDFVMFHVIHIQPVTPRPHWVDAAMPYVSVILWGLSFGIGLFPSIFLTNKLLELWPSVELRMGREWAQLSKTRRDRLWLFFTIAVLPLLIALVYDLLKEVFGK
jgi:hypothetical protein